MKKFLITAISLATSFAAFAQTQYDAADFATSDLNGTARYVGLGGALDALGGDVSVMSSNPAGTAIYKKTDMAVTGSVLFTAEDGQLGHDASRASFDQAGIVFTMNQGNLNKKGLQYINFGVNYQKKKNHFANADIDIDGLNGNRSQTFQAASLANNLYDEYGIKVEQYDMFPGMMAEARTLNFDETATTKPFAGVGASSANYRRTTYGSTTQGDFNVSFNIANQLFLGASLGVYDINYKRDSYYTEMGTDGYAYDINNWYDTNGDGFDVKLGMICRPVADSPFRFGLAVHTPTWYRLEDCNGATVRSNETEVWDAADSYEYDYRTPWKFGFSLGHTFGNVVALGAQYEISDLSSCHYKSLDWVNDEYFHEMNNKIEDQLKTQHTLRVGIEVKPITNFSLRFGYNYVSSPIKEKAWKDSSLNGYSCETDFTNWKGVNRFTCGLGYRFNGGYVDLAYQYQAQKGDFYAFDDETLPPTEIKNNRSQLMATVGFRF